MQRSADLHTGHEEPPCHFVTSPLLHSGGISALFVPTAVGEMSRSDKGVAAVAGYLEHIRTGKRLANRTVNLYAHELAQLSKLCEEAQITWQEVTHSHIRRWIAMAHSAGKGGKTLALQLSAWRSFYRWLVLQDHAKHNPCLAIKPPKQSKPLPKALGVDAAMALAEYKNASGSDTTPLSLRDIAPTTVGATKTQSAAAALGVALCIDPHLRSKGGAPKGRVGSYDMSILQTSLIVELLYGCGLRVSELVGLDIIASADAIQNGRGWIDAEALEVHVFGKGSKRRMVPLGSKAATALSAYLAARQAAPAQTDEIALLLSPKGARLTRQAVWGLLKRQSLDAGLAQSVHPHMLRHSFASHVLQSSGDLRAVQELLGHSSIASTQVYTRLDFQHLAKIYDNTHPRAKLPL